MRVKTSCTSSDKLKNNKNVKKDYDFQRAKIFGYTEEPKGSQELIMVSYLTFYSLVLSLICSKLK